MQTSSRGAFILFEGLDRCGKTTQCKMLTDYLNESKTCEAKSVRFPDRTTAIGVLIDSYLQKKCEFDDKTVHLLFSANRWERDASLRKELASGKTVVCDRYAYSGVAFSAAKGLDLDWCLSPDKGLLAPDVVLYLDVPIDDAAKRGGFGGERYENREMQQRVQQAYKRLMAMKTGPVWKAVPASGSAEDLHQTIREIAMDTIKQAKHRDFAVIV